MLLSSLRRALLFQAVAIALPMALAAAGLLALQWAQQRAQALDLLQEHARALRDAMDRELTLDIAVLNALAASRDLTPTALADFHSLARRTAQVRPGSWVILVDREGRNLLNTAVPYGTPLPNLRVSLARPGTVLWNGRPLPLPALEIFDAPLRTGQPAFSGLVYGRISRQPVVATNVPVTRDGERHYVLGMAYSASFYGDVVRAGEAVHIATILDGTGRIVARNRWPERFVGVQAPTPFDHGTAGLPPQGVGEGRNLEGEPTHYAYSRSRVNDWVALVGIERATLLGPARRVLWRSLAALLPLFVVAVAFATWLSGRIAQPLGALAARAGTDDERAIDSIASGGIREIDALRHAMVEAARAQADRAQAARELACAHARLVEADRRKDEFLGTLGHELRNPLAAIGNAARLLEQLPEADPVKARTHALLVRQVAHVGRLLDDLLDVARIAHGKLSLQRRPLALEQLVGQVAGEAVPSFQARSVQLSLDLAGTCPVEGDEVRLTQVINNLLDNARKYTPSGGSVHLSLAPVGDEAVLRVRDDGVGVPASLLPHVFESFTQDPQSIARSQGGLGLGLAIVRRIVELHAGTVQARSEGPGRGTEIEVRLPLLQDTANARSRLADMP